ncbi:hypothetical protein COR50_13295 [Chitinophaga caeni]|uniref:Glycosyltransferase RgtA/B/C/D-like domain-containing protein n=1 Tax=Chitinophaga caeni TaxID=2029983 RepID=A0A291QVV0_9BACT|nr:glycosyltransferase family 39 protein [Chitinophaga caeni]ATL48060.1 hypothetical protein COR50_13295 [Chitinophaga caeni]
MYSFKYSRYTYYIIIVSFVARCILSISFQLGNDESYYFTYAVQPDWNHFDHPPLVGLFIRMCTFNLHIVNDFTLRLTAIISAAVSTYLIFLIGTSIKNSRTGFIAAVLYNASFYSGIIAGLFILPDSPQMVFWLAAIYTAIKLIIGNAPTKERLYFILFGLYAGLATMCKIHGAFLFTGLGLYFLLCDRSYFKKPNLYISLLIYLLIISPILLWNTGNDFIMFKFQGERIQVHRAFVNFNSFITTLSGQLFYNNPINIIIYILCAGKVKQVFPKNKIPNALKCFALPIIIATCFISLFRTTLPHWSGPGFIPLMLLSGSVIDAYIDKGKYRLQRWMYASASLMIVAVILSVPLINFYPGTIGSKQMPRFGAGDFTLDMYGWKDMKNEFSKIRQLDIDNGLMLPGDPVVIDKWFPACHYYLYITYPLKIRTVGLGKINSLHKFAWLNRLEGNIKKGENAYYINTSENYKDPEAIYVNDFEKITLVKRIWQQRNQKEARYWEVYRLEGARRELGTPVE